VAVLTPSRRFSLSPSKAREVPFAEITSPTAAFILMDANPFGANDRQKSEMAFPSTWIASESLQLLPGLARPGRPGIT
jgi:hypothetical protein